MDKKQLILRLVPVVSGSNWDRLEDYLVFERSELVGQLISSNDIKSINRIQGKILLIDQLLALPETLKKL